MLNTLIADLKADQADGASSAADFADRLDTQIALLEDQAADIAITRDNLALAIRDLQSQMMSLDAQHERKMSLINDTRTLRAWVQEDAKRRAANIDALLGTEPQPEPHQQQGPAEPMPIKNLGQAHADAPATERGSAEAMAELNQAREDMVALAKAAFDAGLAAWPGANIDRLTAEVERLRAALIHARNQIQHPDQLIDEALEPRT